MNKSKMYVLWGTRINNPDWREEIITEKSEENKHMIEDAKTWALSHGFNRLRVAVYEVGDKPDFITAINTERK